jgi:ABC-type multidrug transport system ATPase subunit
VRKAVDETGAAAVWVTHRLEELEHCDMAAYMEDGVITQVGSGDFIRGYIRQQQRAYNAKR